LSLKLRNRYLIPAAAAALALVPAGVASAQPGHPGGGGNNPPGGQTVKCIGNAYFCGATVSLAGGASNKIVTINLTDTNFALVGIRVTPATSRGAFSIPRARFRLGGSQYRFRLNAVKSNPKNAKIILLFAAGSRA